MSEGISFKGIGARFVFAFLLVCFTWNPTRYNYVEWAIARWSNLMPLVVFVGLVLIAAWIFFGHATARSLGWLGITLSMALAATVLWILFYYGLVSTASTTLLSWIVLVLLAGWIYYLRVTARALGVLGVMLSLALSGTVIWILFTYNVVSTQSTTLISWLALILFSFILAMGMSWSHLSRSWSGQVEVDDKDN